MTADRSPLLPYAAPFAEASTRSGGRLAIADEIGWRALNLRLDAADAAPLAAVLGTGLPTAPNTVAGFRGGQVLWLGPDEWLVMSRDDGLEARLRTAASDTALSIVEVSAARAVIRLSGPAARRVLAHGCALDLDAGHFGPGSCAQTRLALTNVILLAEPGQEPVDFAEVPVFLVLVRASFARYLATWLLDAATEYVADSQRTGEPGVTGEFVQLKGA